MRDKTCCFTGHRKIPANLRAVIAVEIEKRIVELIGQGYIIFETGGALGFDTVAAQVVLRVRNQISLYSSCTCFAVPQSDRRLGRT